MKLMIHITEVFSNACNVLPLMRTFWKFLSPVKVGPITLFVPVIMYFWKAR